MADSFPLAFHKSQQVAKQYVVKRLLAGPLTWFRQPALRMTMQPIRQILEDAPEFIPVPTALRHRRVEIILWPLDPASTKTDESLTDYERVKVDRIEIPSRDERHARR